MGFIGLLSEGFLYDNPADELRVTVGDTIAGG